MNIARSRFAARIIGIGFATVVATACGAANGDEVVTVPSKPPVTQTLSGDGYRVALAPAEMIDAAGNETILRGKVTSIGSPIKITETHDHDTFEVVYRPVQISVTDWVRTPSKDTPDRVILRLLGGIAGGLDFRFDGPTADELPGGADVIVFAGKYEVAGDEAAPALTANYLLVREGNNYVDISAGNTNSGRVDADAFLTMLSRS